MNPPEGAGPPAGQGLLLVGVQVVHHVADGLGLDYTLEKITDDDVIDRMDLLMPCLYAYCPGCRVLNEQVTSEHPETLCTPALEINGTLRFWGVPASDDALRQALSSL